MILMYRLRICFARKTLYVQLAGGDVGEGEEAKLEGREDGWRAFAVFGKEGGIR